MTERVQWEELPADFRDAVEFHTGPVITTESVTSGFNCSLALVVRTRSSGCLFLKGARTSDDAGMAGLLCEERVNEVVEGVSPTIRHRFESAGWLALAFVYVDGRHVDYGPGTGDRPALTRATRRMHRLRTPGHPLPQFSDRFAGHLRPGEADILKGSHLLHTDTNPHNVLISAPGGDAYVVDWAMPALGPAWIDPAQIAVWLMAYGHAPADALAWLRGTPSWRQADRRAVETFVNVTCRKFTKSVGEKDAAASNARFHHLLDSRH
ncbi:phosphotransferase family protein [Streptomyces jumonjinensis]|uniref:phosphotransferase family protein n=1 Tax=Streptomyces jumonjinensis TaxID=1945 RepID=UPI00379C1474